MTQTFPSDIAVPLGPGVRYRSMNTTFQRSNEQAPVYELPPIWGYGCIHTLATTVQKNNSNMNVQSSPGFHPFSTSFIKHAEKTIQDDRSKRHKEVLPLPWIQFKSLTVIMLMTLLSLQTRLKIYNSNWTNFITIHVLKGSSSTLTKQKSWSSSAGATLRFPPSRTTAHLWNLSQNSNTLESLLLVMKHAHSCWEDGRQIQVCHCQSLQNWWKQGYQAQKTCSAMAFPGLCFDSWSVRLSSMGHFFFDIWFLKNHTHICPSPGLPEKTLGCQERYWYSLRASRNRSDAPFFLLV